MENANVSAGTQQAVQSSMVSFAAQKNAEHAPSQRAPNLTEARSNVQIELSRLRDLLGHTRFVLSLFCMLWCALTVRTGLPRPNLRPLELVQSKMILMESEKIARTKKLEFEEQILQKFRRFSLLFVLLLRIFRRCSRRKQIFLGARAGSSTAERALGRKCIANRSGDSCTRLRSEEKPFRNCRFRS